MSFHEVLFPVEISYGSQGGPKFKTTIFTADSGYEQRNIDWSSTRAEYNVSHGIKTQAQMDELTSFFYQRRGRAYGFRFKDFNDFQLKQEVIGVGDGETTAFQITRTYTSIGVDGTEFSFTRKITKIMLDNSGNPVIAGVSVGSSVKTSPADYTVNASTGIMTFTAAPPKDAAVKIGAGEFCVPVRFDTDHLDASHDFWNTQSWGNIPLVEVRDWKELFPVTPPADPTTVTPPANPNSILNSSMTTDYGFTAPFTTGSTTMVYGRNLTTVDSGNVNNFWSSTRNVIWTTYQGTPAAGEYFNAPIPMLDRDHAQPVKAGDNIYGRALVGYLSLDNARLIIVFFDANFAELSEQQIAQGGKANGGYGGGDDAFENLFGYATAPAGAVWARLIVRGIPPANPTTSPYLFYAEPMLSDREPADTGYIPYIPGDPDNTDAGRASGFVNGGSVGGSAGSGGSASVPVVNAVYNSSWTTGGQGWVGGYGYYVSQTGAADPHVVNSELNLTDGGTNYFSTSRNVMRCASVDAFGGTEHFQITRPVQTSLYCMAVSPGDNIYASGLYAVSNLDHVQLNVRFFDAKFNELSVNGVATGGKNGAPAGATDAGFELLWGYVTAPANAAFAQYLPWGRGPSPGNCSVFMSEPMMTKAPTGQTTQIAYVPGAPAPNTAGGAFPSTYNGEPSSAGDQQPTA